MPKQRISSVLQLPYDTILSSVRDFSFMVRSSNPPQNFKGVNALKQKEKGSADCLRNQHTARTLKYMYNLCAGLDNFFKVLSKYIGDTFSSTNCAYNHRENGCGFNQPAPKLPTLALCTYLFLVC